MSIHRTVTILWRLCFASTHPPWSRHMFLQIRTTRFWWDSRTRSVAGFEKTTKTRAREDSRLHAVALDAVPALTS